jgi:hypothetical protein
MAARAFKRWWRVNLFDGRLNPLNLAIGVLAYDLIAIALAALIYGRIKSMHLPVYWGLVWNVFLTWWYCNLLVAALKKRRQYGKENDAAHRWD